MWCLGFLGATLQALGTQLWVLLSPLIAFMPLLSTSSALGIFQTSHVPLSLISHHLYFGGDLEVPQYLSFLADHSSKSSLEVLSTLILESSAITKHRCSSRLYQPFGYGAPSMPYLPVFLHCNALYPGLSDVVVPSLYQYFSSHLCFLDTSHFPLFAGGSFSLGFCCRRHSRVIIWGHLLDIFLDFCCLILDRGSGTWPSSFRLMYNHWVLDLDRNIPYMGNSFLVLISVASISSSGQLILLAGYLTTGRA